MHRVVPILATERQEDTILIPPLPDSRKTQKSSSSDVKYCSDRCRRHKLRAIDHQIETMFATLLDGLEVSGPSPSEDAEIGCPAVQAKKSSGQQQGKQKKVKVKGDPRIIVLCSEVEARIFGIHDDPEKTSGRKKNRAPRGIPDDPEGWQSVDMEDSDTDPGSIASINEEPREEPVEGSDGGVPIHSRVRPPQSKSDVNGSIGGEKGWAERIDETPEMLLKRREGQKRAEQREQVRCAARRAVVFGVQRQAVTVEEGKKKKANEKADQGDHKKLCEAFMNGKVVDPSFAKGDWGIRHRAD